MTKIFGGIKDKKFLFFAVATSVVLTSAVFLFFYLRDKERTESPIAPAVPREKTIEEVVESLTAPEGGETISVPKEILDSMTASTPTPVPVDPKKNKIVQPTPISVPKDILNSLTAPTN